MALRTARQYLDSLRDDRVVFYAGERVRDVVEHPHFGLRAAENARQYGRGADEDAETLALRTVRRADGQTVHRWLEAPRSRDDLLKFVAMEEGMPGDAHGAMTAGLTGLQIVARSMDAKFGTKYAPRIDAYVDWYARNDLHGAFAMTDEGRPLQAAVRPGRPRPVGARRRAAARRHRDSRREDLGEFGRARQRAAGAAHARHGPADADWSVACAVPANAPGVVMISNYSGAPWGERFRFDRPVNFNTFHHDATVVFNDVFVPTERVFMDGEFDHTRELLGYFTTFHRTGILVNEPRGTKLIGAAQLMARYNGLENVGAIRSTIAQMIETAQLLEALRFTALNRTQTIEGICVPDAVACNLAGLTVSGTRDGYLTFLCELCGGPVLTAPSGLDLRTPRPRRWCASTTSARTA